MISYIKLRIDNNIPKIRIGKEDSKHVLIDDDSVDIVDNNTTLASFGETSQIGNNDASHSYFDYHSFQMIDKEGNTYFHVSDLRDAQGEASVMDQFVGTGSQTNFTLSFNFISPLDSVKIDEVETSEYALFSSKVISFNKKKKKNAVITINYKTKASIAKAYTFGIRADDNIGALSVAEGNDTTANGNYSHAEGWNTTASGQCSHAEGYYATASGGSSHAEGYYARASGSSSHAEGYRTRANGAHSHAEGYYATANGILSHAEGYYATANGILSHAEGNYTTTNGNYSHASGDHTTASANYQFVIGRYNIEGTNHSFVIGNGTADDNRSDSLAITWDSNIQLALNTTASSGTTDADLYDAITALGWGNDVLI